jgi:hypothetical protein
MINEALRTLIHWHNLYQADWDDLPDAYIDHGVVQWGHSRRLGRFEAGAVKAYLGVQHVDPGRPGWAIVDQPQARFFLSLFVSGDCVTLKTFAQMDQALDMLGSFLSSLD